MRLFLHSLFEPLSTGDQREKQSHPPSSGHSIYGVISIFNFQYSRTNIPVWVEVLGHNVSGFDDAGLLWQVGLVEGLQRISMQARDPQQ